MMMIQSHRRRWRELVPTALAAAVLVVCSAPKLGAQAYDWAWYGHGSAWKRANAVVVDRLGNTLFGMEFSDSLYSDGSSQGRHQLRINNIPTDLGTLRGKAYHRGVIVAADGSGNVTGTFVITPDTLPSTTINDATVTSLALYTSSPPAADTFLYVTGRINGTVRFDFNSGPMFKVAKVQTSSSYLAKYRVGYTSNGTVLSLVPLWVTTFEPDHPDDPDHDSVAITGVAVDSSGNPYICGSIDGQAGCTTHIPQNTTSIAPERIPFNQGSQSAKQLLVAQCSPDPLVNAKAIVQTATSSGIGTAQANGIALSGTGNVIVTGYYSGNISFGTTTPTPINSGKNLVVAGINISAIGVSQWKWVSTGATSPTGPMPEPPSARGNAVAVDREGNAYVVGEFTGTMTLTPQSVTLTSARRNFFMVCYDPDGAINATTFGGISATGDAFARGVTAHGNAVYITGGFSDTMLLGNTTLGSMGNHDIFIGKYNDRSTGSMDLAWAQRAGNSWEKNVLRDGVLLNGITSPHFDQGTAIAVTASGEAVIAGEFGGTSVSNIQPLSGINVHDSPRNVFVMKLTGTATHLTGKVTRGNPGPPLGNQVVEVVVTTNSPRYYATTSSDRGAYDTYVHNGGTPTSALLSDDGWVPTGLTLAPPPGIKDTKAPNCSIKLDIIPQSTEYAVPGSIVRYLIRYQNVGSVDINNLGLTIQPHVNLKYLGYAMCPDISGTTFHSWSGLPPAVITINLPGPLGQQQQGQVAAWFRLDSLDTPPQEIRCTVSCTGNCVDAFNGTTGAGIIKQVVVQPNDPNDKYATPAGKIPITRIVQGKSINYTINFRNDGDATADSVTITDYMSPPDAADVTNANQVQASGNIPSSISLTPSVTLGNGWDPWSFKFGFGGCRLKARIESHTECTGSLTFAVPLRPTLPIGSTVTDSAVVQFNGGPGVLTTSATNCIIPDFEAGPAVAGRQTRFLTWNTTESSVINYLWSDPAMVARCWWNFGDSTDVYGFGAGDPVSHIYKNAGIYNASVDIEFRSPVRICDSVYNTYRITHPVVVRPRLPEFTLRIDTIHKRLLVRMLDTVGGKVHAILIAQNGTVVRQTHFPKGQQKGTIDIQGLSGRYMIVLVSNKEWRRQPVKLP